MTLKSTPEILQSLQAKNGLFIAAPAPGTGYNKAWIRDNIYETLGLELINPEGAVRVMHRLLDILHKHESKISWAIENKPGQAYQYIHARFHPETLEEFWEEWGNKQNDAVGALLFRIADLLDKGYHVLRGEKDKEILEKLVHYLASVEYWHDPDNGVWEEYEEVHASSVGACVAGLSRISKYISVPKNLIKKGQDTLNYLLPRESETKDVDLALISLVYPFNVVNEKQKKAILKNIEKHLVKEKGVIRYKGDAYYNEGGEAEWTMGFPWLAKIYKDEGNQEKFQHYMKKTIECINKKGELPELYFANSNKHNDNSPLGWAQSLYLVAAL